MSYITCDEVNENSPSKIGLTIEKVLLSANVCEESKFKKISNEFSDLICENIEKVANLPEVKYLSSSFLEMLIMDKRWVISDAGDEDGEENDESEEGGENERNEEEGDEI